MSATSGTQVSTKGESTSSKSSKSGYDHLDINKLYKGKSTEPVAKTVTQKHGMQALGKALPARRGGSTVVKAEPTPTGTGSTNNISSSNNNINNNDLANSSSSSAPPPSSQQQKPLHNLGQPPPHHPQQQYPHHLHHPPGPQGWTQQNSSQSFPPPGSAGGGGAGAGPQRPPGPASPHHHHHPHHPPPPHHHHHPPPHHHPLHNSAPNAAKTGGGGPMHDKNWSGGPPPDMLNNSSGRDNGPGGRGPPGKGNFPGTSSKAAAAAAAAQESMQRFAQEFPSLDSGGGDGAAGKGGQNSAHAGKNNNQDNQYGPGPILRPQTEGSWTQGGGRGMPRPPGPPPPSSSGVGAPGASSSTRDFGPGAERPNMGGPTPPPMSLGPAGHPPPPLGAFPMQFPPRPPYMYPNSGPGGPPGPGGPGPGFYPPGGMPGPRYGMPIPPGAPPPPSSLPHDGPPGGGEGHPPPRRAGGRGGHLQGPMRPASNFTSKPIIKAEELERMDELGQQDGGWATVQDDIDYNKKISFSDDEGQGGDKENSRVGRRQQQQDDGRGDGRDARITPRESRGERDRDYREEDPRDSRQSGRPMKILERPPQQMNDPRDQRDSIMRGNDRGERDQRGGDRYGDPTERDGLPSSGRYQNDYNESSDQDDWKRKQGPGYDNRGGPRDDRDGGGRGPPLSQQNRGGRMINRGPPPPREEEESWRSGGSNSRPTSFDEDPRNSSKKDRDRAPTQAGGPMSGRGGDRERESRGPPPNSQERSAANQGGESGSLSRRGPPERAERGGQGSSGPTEGPPNMMRGNGGGGGGAGDFGPASGPFQNNLPPRLQRHFPPMFGQQQERNNQRKTPSPVPSSNAVKERDRDFRDRSDRDREWDRNDRNERDRDRERDREPQRPAYKILERNRGDSESSKDSSTHREHARNNRFGGSGSNNDADTVPVRSHRDKPDSTKRLSSDSGRLLLDEDSKMSPKDMDSMDSSYDSLRGSNQQNSKQDNLEGSASLNNKNSMTSYTRNTGPPRGMGSWADEVDDDQDYNSSDLDGPVGGSSSRKGSLIRDLKRGDHQVHPSQEERRPPPREMPRRVIIQQTKVENMKSDVQVESRKPDPPAPEPQKPVEPVKIVEKPTSGDVKSKGFTAWGDRDSLREKSKTTGGDANAASQDASSKDGGKDGSERDSHSSDREPGSEKQQTEGGKGNKAETENDKGHHHHRDKMDRDRDRDRHYDNRYGGRYDKGSNRDRDRDIRGGDRDRDTRQKPRRMDSYEQSKQQSSRDNRTPDRDNRDFGGRSSQEKDRGGEGKSGLEKTKSGDRLEKGEPNKDKGGDKDVDFREDRRNDRDDYDRGHRGGGRGKERGGYGVYQPRGGSHSDRDRGDRGGWGRDDKSRKGEDSRGRGGGRGSRVESRDYYDKPSSGGRGGRGELEKERVTTEKEDRVHHHHQQSDAGDRKERNKDKESASDLSNKGSVEDLGRDKSKGGGSGPGKEKSGDSQKEQSQDKGKKSPGTQRRSNNVRGGTRLHGYGPPSDKNPFGSGGGSHKEGEQQEGNKRDAGGDGGRDREQVPQQQNNKPAPVPLMALGDISPPNMQNKGSRGGRDVGRDRDMRDQGGRGGQRGMPPRMQRDGNDYGRESSGGFRGGQQRDADRSDRSSKSGRGGGGRGGSTGDAKPLMSINSNEVEGSNEWESESGDSVEDDSSKRSTGGAGPQGRKDGSGGSATQQPDSGSDSLKKKNSGSTNVPSSKSQQTPSDSSGKSSSSTSSAPKDRRIKNPPYDPRPNKNQSGNTWDSKSINSGKEQQQQPIGGHSNSSTPALQDVKEEKSVTTASVPTVTSSLAVVDTGPLKTMIFENTNFKSINNSSGSGGGAQPSSGKAVKGPMGDSAANTGPSKKDGGLGDLGGFSFGKVEGSSDIDFGNFNEGSTGGGSSTVTSNSSSATTNTTVPKPIGQPRGGGYSSHQPSPISPQAAALDEKVQSVKRIWEPVSLSAMPSVQEQSVGGAEHPDSSSFHGGFDTFKGDASNQYVGLPQGPAGGYAPGTSPALSAISKPESSSSPTSTNLRMTKASQQQPAVVDSSASSGQISSPFGGGYAIQSQQGSNAFSSMPAVPSPPNVMATYGTSQTLHAAANTGPHSGMYQTFPDAHQVMNAASGRGGYGQFPNHHTAAAGNGQYGLFLSTPMEGYSMTYQHQQSSQGGQTGGTSRISPGPMTTQGNSGVIISSTSSMMNASKGPGQQGSGQNYPSMNPISHTPQQGYSQMSHHHQVASIGSHHSHPQAPPPHHLGPVAKPGYSQGAGLGTPSQTPVFIPFDPNPHQQSTVISLGGQNFLSSAMSRGHPQGPPPPQTPPVQQLQSASSYYSTNSGSSSGVFPGQGGNQAANLQQLHVAVAANPQAIQGYHSASQLGLQYPAQLNTQGYNLQQAAASTVSALNLNSQIMRNPGPPQSHTAYMKQPASMDLMSGAQLKSSHEAQTLLNQNWNTAAYQAFHVAATQQQQQQQAGKAPGSNPNDGRGNPVGGAAGNAIGGQRKGNNLGGGHPQGTIKYMSAQGPGGYSGQVQQQ